jgi:flagellar basal-body rod modification protein FlgD
MAAAAIFAHRMTPVQALTGNAVKPMDSSSSGNGSTSSASDDAAAFSANDFLSLLVTEMQNQDPTSDTDPNEYVDQLVQVNSLEQLISINQTLTTSLDPSSSTSGADAANAKAGAAPVDPITQAAASSAPQAATMPTHKPDAQALPAQLPGNLGVPAPNPAAQRVGHALGGHVRPKPTVGRFPSAL